jgi:ATP-binding protein involved in chromosome partitioning
MLNFYKRKRLINAIKRLKSTIIHEYFSKLLTKISFEKSKVLMFFEISGLTKPQAENFETEVSNIATLCGFASDKISVIITGKSEKLNTQKQTETLTKNITGIKKIICVASCKGGVGKSTIAINLAKDYAEKGYKVGILDADIYGPSIPIMLEIAEQKMPTENGKLIPIEKDGILIASMGFIVKSEDALMWRGAMVTKAITGLFEGVKWGELDLLVVDLPPGTGDVYISLLTNYKVTGVLMVSSPHIVSIEEMKKTLQLFNKFNVKVLGVVENMTEGSLGVEDELKADFKVERRVIQKHGFLRFNLNLAERLQLTD